MDQNMSWFIGISQSSDSSRL